MKGLSCGGTHLVCWLPWRSFVLAVRCCFSTPGHLSACGARCCRHPPGVQTTLYPKRRCQVPLNVKFGAVAATRTGVLVWNERACVTVGLDAMQPAADHAPVSAHTVNALLAPRTRYASRCFARTRTNAAACSALGACTSSRAERVRAPHRACTRSHPRAPHPRARHALLRTLPQCCSKAAGRCRMGA